MNSSRCASWHNPRILFTLLLVFLAGASAGMVTMSLGHHRWLHHSPPAWKEGGREVSLETFRKELDLTPAQTEQLETILDDYLTYYDTLQAQLNDVRASGHQRMLRILDEKQKRKFDQLMNEMQQTQLR